MFLNPPINRCGRESVEGKESVRTIRENVGKQQKAPPLPAAKEVLPHV